MPKLEPMMQSYPVPKIYQTAADESKPAPGYEESDMKRQYLADFDLRARMVAPVVRRPALP